VEDIIGKPLEAILRPQSGPPLAAIGEGEQHREWVPLLRGDETVFPAEIRSWPLFVEGTQVGTVFGFHDISHRLEADRDRIAREAAEQANESKSLFLANMSHELRTPLNSVIALTGVLRRRLASHISLEEQGFLEVIEKNGQHLLALINQILDLSRIETGKEQIRICTIDLMVPLIQAIEMVSPQAAQKQLPIETTFEHTQSLVYSDPDKLLHIFQNIIGNAVKFTDSGKVLIEIESDEDQYRVIVSDTGPGMDQDCVHNLYEPFYQGEISVSGQRGGSGLGLSIASRYAEMLLIHLTVDTLLGRGTSFTISIPKRGAFDSQEGLFF
jgi:signal transduction histidine kinase